MPALQHRRPSAVRAREDVAGLPRVDADARRGLVEQAVDDVDLGLQRLERRQSLAELHLGPIAVAHQ